MNQNITAEKKARILSLFNEWLNNWEDGVLSLEGVHAQELFKKKVLESIDVLEYVLSEFDKKVMAKHKTDEDKVQAMIKNQDQPYYKDMRKVINNLHSISSEIERLYALQNRVISENFKLRKKIYAN